MSNRFVVQPNEGRFHNDETADDDHADDEHHRQQQGVQRNQNQQRGHSNVKQANKITLDQRKGVNAQEEMMFTMPNELEHLLSGQQEPQQQQLLLHSNARVNFKEHDGAASVANYDGQQQSSMTQCNNNDSNNKNTGSNSQLDIQKFPPEMHYDEQQQENRTTIILAPTSFNTTTAITTSMATQGAADGGNGINNSAGVDAASLASNAFKGPEIWRHLVRHWPTISQPLTILIIFLLMWAIGYILLPQYAVPSTGIMRIAFLFVGAQTAGILVTFLRLPDMLGMLFFGVLYTNVGLADFSGYQRLEAFLREMALINIMLLAGLGLDWNAFKKLWLMILRLTVVPTIAEVAIITVIAKLLLDMPWLWGILLGLVITAVSPNVVVTVMLKLKEDRLGLNSGIHTLIYAMTTCNDVISIFTFGVFLGVIFSTGTLTDQILQGPIGFAIGLVFGYLYGLFLVYVPSRKSFYVNGLRFVLIIFGGTIAVMGSKAIGYPSAGALGCVTVAFVAGIGWKKQQLKHPHPHLHPHPHHQDVNENSSVAKRLDLLWKFLKPVSFSLIGKEINFGVLEGKVVGYGLLLVLLGSLFRLGFAYISTYGGNLSRKERAYITISGFPKATVQAALGPIALDSARSLNADQGILTLANNVLIISVLAIIFTAPIGAILMLRLAPLWLKHSSRRNSGNYEAQHDDARNITDISADRTRNNNDSVMNSIKYPALPPNLNYEHNGNKSRNVDEAPAQTAAVVDDYESDAEARAARHLV